MDAIESLNLFYETKDDLQPGLEDKKPEIRTQAQEYYRIEFLVYSTKFRLDIFAIGMDNRIGFFAIFYFLPRIQGVKICNGQLIMS